MQLSVRGYKSNTLSLKEMRFAIRWFANLLLPKKVLEDIEINISLKNMKDTGYVDFLTDEPGLKIFELGLNRQNDKETQLITIAHEMVHIKHYALKEMRYTNNNDIVWRKRIASAKTLREEPWEAEAYEQEQELYTKYLKFKQKERLTF